MSLMRLKQCHRRGQWFSRANKIGLKKKELKLLRAELTSVLIVLNTSNEKEPYANRRLAGKRGLYL
jgi:hypothetical protein